MPQIPVLSYVVQVNTNPPQVPGAPPTPFRVGVAVQLQKNGPFQPLPINGPDEFMAVMAVLQVPGQLVFDPVGVTLEKVGP
jgi:hypothetical protein